MIMRLPPINAIRVFEAAARLGGFTRAAGELGMTQAAVSYQIKQLEDRLGFPLFVREGRRVNLTRQGEALSERTSEAFRILERAFDAARRGGDDILTISALPTFCENWLVPRLSAFQKAHPRLGVRIDADRRLVDVRGGEADIAVRVGSGDWPGLETRFLFPGSEESQTRKLRRWIGRLRLADEDARLLQGILRQVQWKLDHPDG